MDELENKKLKKKKKLHSERMLNAQNCERDPR